MNIIRNAYMLHKCDGIHTMAAFKSLLEKHIEGLLHFIEDSPLPGKELSSLYNVVVVLNTQCYSF